MRPRILAPALCLLILSSVVPGAARAEPPEASLHDLEDHGAADERQLEEAQEAFLGGAPLRPVYWPAVLSFGVAGAGVLAGVSATLSAEKQLDAADRVLQRAAAATPGDRMVCPTGTASPSCLEVEARLEDARRLQELAVAGYAVGALAAVVGAALAVWPFQVRSGEQTAAVTPVTSPQGGGLLVVGTF